MQNLLLAASWCHLALLLLLLVLLLLLPAASWGFSRPSPACLSVQPWLCLLHPAQPAYTITHSVRVTLVLPGLVLLVQLELLSVGGRRSAVSYTCSSQARKPAPMKLQGMTPTVQSLNGQPGVGRRTIQQTLL